MPTASDRQRLVFLDFDGTYADHGVVPAAHLEAVRTARRNGHLVFLCTGRSRATVAERVLAELDGLVGAAGGYVEIADEVLHDERFPPDLGARVVRLLQQHRFSFALEAPDATYVPDHVARQLEAEFRSGIRDEQAVDDLMNSVRTADDLTTVSFSKISCFGGDMSLLAVRDELGGAVALITTSLDVADPTFGELYLPHITKAVGVSIVAERMSADPSDVVAAGDGFNDIEMLRHAGTAIAIEGGPSQLLAHADLVVPGPRSAGLARAFADLGLV